MSLDSPSLSIPRKTWGIVYGLLVAAGTVVVVPIAAFLLALVFTLINQVTGLLKLGETQAWLGIIFALYAMYADIVIGPVVWWRVCAKRLDLSPKTKKIGTTMVLTFFCIVCLWVLHGEQAITNSAHLEAVTDDGKFVLASPDRSGSAALYSVDTSTGDASRLTAVSHGYEANGAFSPNNRDVAFAYSEDEKNYTIMLTDISGKGPRPLLQKGGNDSWPQFSRDGRKIYFLRTTGKGFDLFSAGVDGSELTQLTHQHFSFDGEPYLQAAPALSSDARQLLFTTNDSLQLYSLSDGDHRPENLLFPLPNAPASRNYVSAYFSPDDAGVVFMASSESNGAYGYDAYRVDLLSRKVQKLTANNGYASDFRVSLSGKKAVFLKWQFTRFQKLPHNFQMQLMDMGNGQVCR